mgnify:FL=1
MVNAELLCVRCMQTLETPRSVCPHCGYDNAIAENAAHQLECGSILCGTYFVGRVLGQGGFGITYVGMDLNLEKKVAIKEYYPEGCVTRDIKTHATVLSFEGEKTAFFRNGRERFVDEAKTLAMFSGDSGIVNVRTFFFENGTAYIVMDFVDGETLKSLAARSGGKLPVDRVFELFEPLLRSITRVHEAGLLHRDISPDNIILQPNGTLILLDFGAARQMSISGEHSNTISVKHGYAPEEQYRTRGEQGPWTDVYALCATIYKLITGETPPQALDRAMNGDILKTPTELGAPMGGRRERALIRGLAVRAPERVQSINELIGEFYGEETGEAESAPAVKAIAADSARADAISGKEEEPRDKKRLSKKKLIVLAAGVLVCLLAVVLGAALLPEMTIRANKKEITELLQTQEYHSAAEKILAIDNKSGKYDEAFYSYAETLLKAGKLDDAEKVIQAVEVTADFDVVSVEDEIYYQQAQNALEAELYNTARKSADKIVDAEKYNVDAFVYQTYENEIAVNISKQEYVLAISLVEKLARADAALADRLKNEFYDQIYTYAENCFWGYTAQAIEVFRALGNYRSSSDFLFILNLENDFDEYVKSLTATESSFSLTPHKSYEIYSWDIEYALTLIDSGFEVAGEFVLSDYRSAFWLLEGRWSGNGQYFNFYRKADGNLHADWSLPGIKSGTWNFQNRGEFTIQDSKGNKTIAARFKAISRSEIEVTVVSTGNTYTLRRAG